MSGPGALPALPAEVHQGQPGQQEGQDRVRGQFSYKMRPGYGEQDRFLYDVIQKYSLP